MPLAPPFARLHPHAAEHAGPARAVTVTLPGDLAEWLDRMCADEAQRDALAAFALDAARDYGIRGRWPDPPPEPKRPETFEEFQAMLNGVREDLGIEPGDLDGWLREREEERDRLAAQDNAAGHTGPSPDRRAAA